MCLAIRYCTVAFLLVWAITPSADGQTQARDRSERVRIRIVDSDENPVPNAEIQIISADDASVLSGTANQHGEFYVRLAATPPGRPMAWEPPRS